MVKSKAKPQSLERAFLRVFQMTQKKLDFASGTVEEIKHDWLNPLFKLRSQSVSNSTFWLTEQIGEVVQDSSSWEVSAEFAKT